MASLSSVASLAAFTALAYLLGSIPSGVWIGYAFTGRDIRGGGSGHSGGTNTIRQAGWAAGVIVAALDVGKGALAVWLAAAYGGHWLAGALAAGAAAAGHCWPILAGFRGGMGLAPAAGALLVIYPLGAAIGLGLLILAAFALKHSARAALSAAVVLVPVIWLMSGSNAVGLTAAAIGGVVAVRALSDWNRKQTAVWLSERGPG